MKHMRKALCMLLALVMVIGLLPMAALASFSDDSFTTTVMLDCGRGYYTVDQVKSIIDEMYTDGYEYLMLGFGNDGLRFLLDDMSVTVDGTTYSSDRIKNAIIAKNDELAPNAKGEWTESDMNTIVAYAQSKGIEIVPMIDTPGHATSITAAMTACGINAALSNRNNSTDSGSTTFDVTNTTAVAFAKALQQKYIDYFAAKGSTAFNLGMDEYAGNNGGWSNMSTAERTALASYLSDMATILNNAGMKPLAFCDVIGNISNVPSSVVGINWNGGYLKNNSNINANYDWYYVLGATGTGWAGFDKALSYTASTPVTQARAGTADAGSLLAIWNDNYLATTDAYIQNIKNLIASQATNNPTYFTMREVRNVTVAVSGTYSESVTADTITTEPDSSIATAALETGMESDGYTKVTAITSGAKYLFAANTNRVLTSLSASNSWSIKGFQTTSATVSNGEISGTAYDSYLWTITKTDSGYTLQNSSGAYLAVDEENPDVKSWGTNYPLTTQTTPYYFTLDAANGTIGSAGNSTIFLNNYGGANTCVAAYTGASTITFYEKNTTGNELTITGVAVGTTTAVVGNITYNIKVTPEDISTKSLTYYPFIADFAVHAEGTGASACTSTEGVGNAQTLAATTEGVNTEAGVALTDVAWPTGDWRWEGDSVQTVYWKGVVHSATDTKQIGTKYDLSLSGTDFAYVRYLNGTWAVSADRETWTNITADDEVCVYYLQETDVTDEVTTYVKDWAFTTDDYSSYYSNSKGHKALSVAVVYPDGQMSPSVDDIYSASTMIYWADTGVTSDTDTLLMRFGVNDVYKISKITYTFGTITSEDDTPSGSLSWQTKSDDDGNTWYKETTYWDDSKTTEPVLKTSDFLKFEDESNTFDANGDAMLVLIYLKPVVTEDSLTVQYWDDSANTEILNYAVNIENKSTDTEKGTFLNRLVQASEVKAGELTLDDNAYVVNYAGKNETFEKQLTAIPSLRGGKYATGFYQYVKAVLSEDGKTLILHYNLSTDVDAEVAYVIDFGLSVKIPEEDLLPAGNTAEIKTVSVRNSTYATVTYADGVITYTPSQVLKGTDVFKVTLTLSDGSTLNRNVAVYPATTVYYEESFATMTGFTVSGTAKNTTQATVKVEEEKDYTGNWYGYDAAYTDDGVGASNGTYAVSSTRADKAEFTFTGTGVDVYANCTGSTGYLLVQVLKNGTLESMSLINTVTTNTAYSTLSGSDEYNLPVYSVGNLPYGEYTIRILNPNNGVTVYFDGFRVYNPLGDDASTSETATAAYKAAVEAYTADREEDPTFINLRDELVLIQPGDPTVDGAEGTAADNPYFKTAAAAEGVLESAEYKNSQGAVIISLDTADADRESMINNGPKNEVYLLAGETLVFKADTEKDVQLGMKALIGSVTVSGSYAGTIGSSTDMFYLLSYTETEDGYRLYQITNEGSGTLALTKIKICDEPNGALTALTMDSLDIVFEAMGLMTKGDADANGKLSLMDVAKAFQIATENSEVSKYLLKVLDMNGDGKLNIIDVSMIYAKYIGR